MAQLKQSDRVRQLVSDRYVRPALNAGQTRLTVKVRDVLKLAEATENFPRGRTPLICEVLQGKKLLNEHGLEIESIEGPPSKQSRTVVVHYRLAQQSQNTARAVEVVAESSAARAQRLTDSLRGLLKNELAEYGGAEGFIRWMRHDEEPPV